MKLHFSPGKIFLLIYTFLVFLSFCAPLPESLKSSTESAGKNKNEIKKLIRHYRSPVDSLKRESAIFLISNMKGSYTLDTNSVSPNNVYFDLMEDLYRTYEGRYGNELLLHAMDSFNNSMGIVPGRPESTYLEDLKTVKADFLIENIDLAMEAWQNSPWGVNVSFKDFCNFILPYKFSKTYWEEARRLFLKKYAWVYDSVNDSPDCFYADKLITEEVNSWFNEDTPIFFFNIPWLKPITFYNLLKGKWGDCEDANSIKATALRALGVPVAFDIP